MYILPSRAGHEIIDSRGWLDDVGGPDDLEWLHGSLAHEWSIVVRAILGPPGSPGCSQSTVILNRIVSWETWGISWEADPRHAELAASALGVSCQKVSTPASKDKGDDPRAEESLGEEDARVYRSVAMRVAYLATDRPDLQQCARELAKGLQNPPKGTGWR